MDPFFTYLVESHKALCKIEPLTTNQILFEAEDNEKVAQIARNNEKNAEKSQNMFMKAITALKNLIDKVIDAIKNFIDYLGLSKDQKAMYKEFRAKVKNNPEFAGKKVTVKVCLNAKQVYGNLIKEVENKYKNAKDAEADARNAEYTKVLDNVKNNLTYVTKSVSLAALCKMIDENEAFAREIEAAIMMDKMTVNNLEKTYGKKGVKDIQDHIKVKTTKTGMFKLGFTGLKIRIRQKESECVGDTLKNLTKDIPALMSAASAIDKEKTDTIKNDVMDVVKVGGKAGIKGALKRYGREHSLTKRIKKKFTKNVELADSVQDSSEYLRFRKKEDVKESAESIPFHHYYLSDYYNEAKKDSKINFDPRSASAFAIYGAAAIGTIAIGTKLSKKHKENIRKMFRLYEANHPHCTPASEFNFGVYGEDEAKDFRIKTMRGNSFEPSKYYIYTDKRGKAVMYTIKLLDKNGRIGYDNDITRHVNISTSRELTKSRYEFHIVSSSLSKDSTYYRAYMAYKTGVSSDALSRFIQSMKQELKRSKKTFKETAYDMILEDTEFDDFEDYLESSDSSLFFDEFYKEAESFEML